MIQANPTSGTSPLTVKFNGSGSSDPEGQTLDLRLGPRRRRRVRRLDVGAPSVHVQRPAGRSPSRLRVTDPARARPTSRPWSISVNNTRADRDHRRRPRRRSPGRSATRSRSAAARPIRERRLAAGVGAGVVGHHAPLPVELPHARHADVRRRRSGSFTAPDHEYPSHLELRLTATDAAGCRARRASCCNPQTVALTFQSQPPGCSWPSTARRRRRRSPARSSSARPTRSARRRRRPRRRPRTAFSSWSDGGAQVHNITAPGVRHDVHGHLHAGDRRRPGWWPRTASTRARRHDRGCDRQGAHRIDRRRDVDGRREDGDALSFNGISNSCTVADARRLDLTTGLTMEAWVRPTTLSGWRTVALKEAPPGDLAYALVRARQRAAPGRLLQRRRNRRRRAGSRRVAAEHVDTPGGDVRRGERCGMFVNGGQAGVAAVSGALIGTDNPLRIGGNNVWGEWFAGQIDEVRIYNRALSAGEIATDMNTPVGGAPPPDTTPPTVSITSPAAGGARRAARSRSRQTRADNSGTVANVQFLVDGAPLGGPDTTRAVHGGVGDRRERQRHARADRAGHGRGRKPDDLGARVRHRRQRSAVGVDDSPTGGTVSGTITVSGDRVRQQRDRERPVPGRRRGHRRGRHDGALQRVVDHVVGRQRRPRADGRRDRHGRQPDDIRGRDRHGEQHVGGPERARRGVHVRRRHGHDDRRRLRQRQHRHARGRHGLVGRRPVRQGACRSTA